MSQKSGIFSQETLNLLSEIDDLTHIFTKSQPVYELKSNNDNANNIEVSAQHVILPNDVFYSMMNSCATNSGYAATSDSNLNFDTFDLGDTVVTFSHHQQQQQQQQQIQLQQQQQYQNQLIKSSSLPSNVVFPGDYDFEIEFSNDSVQNKSATWTYSTELNKLYSKLGVSCPIKIKINQMPPVGTIVRFVAVYKKDEHKKEIIKRCANHTDSKEFNENHPASSHFIRIENINTVYANDKSRSTYVPYEAPQMATAFTIYLAQFMCYNSCIGGGKKPIEIIVTLEKNGVILGRQLFDIKICACPYRDKETEEKSLHKSSNETKTTKSRKSPVSEPQQNDYEIKKEVEINIIKKSPEMKNNYHKLNDSNNNLINKDKRIFTLQIEGEANYLILKNLLDALYAKDRALMLANGPSSSVNNYENFNEKVKIKPKLSKKQSTIVYEKNADEDATDLKKFDLNKKPSGLSRSDTVERFLCELDLPNYSESFRSAGFNTISELLDCQEDDIEKLNIGESHTKEIWNGISFLKTNFEESQIPSSQQQQQQDQQNIRKNNSIEITKLSMKYSVKQENIENNGDNNRVVTRKRSFSLQQQQQDNSTVTNVKRKKI